MVNELREHIEGLAKANGITVQDSTRRGRAYHRSRRIAIRPIKSARTYWIALHEIGHLIAKRRSLGGRCEKEATAWRWALDNSIVEPTPAEWRHIAKCLRSYLLWAENRQYRKVPPRLPTQDFLDLLWKADELGEPAIHYHPSSTPST